MTQHAHGNALPLLSCDVMLSHQVDHRALSLNEMQKGYGSADLG